MAHLMRSALYGYTELHTAAAAGDVARVQLAVQKKPQQLNRTTTEGQTALHLAAANGFEVVVRELLARGAVTTLQDKAGRSPLHLAAAAGHVGCVQELLGRNNRESAEVKYQLMALRDLEGQDALMAAVVAGREGSCRVLLSALGSSGAGHCVDRASCGPMLVAVQRQHVHLLPMLAAAAGGPDRERDPATGSTPLHAAARLGLLAALHVLLAHGASTTTRDNAGRTASDVALEAGQQAAYRLLREAQTQPPATTIASAAGARAGAAAAAAAGQGHSLLQQPAMSAVPSPAGGGPGGSPPAPAATAAAAVAASVPVGRLQIPAVPSQPVVYPQMPEGAGVYF